MEAKVNNKNDVAKAMNKELMEKFIVLEIEHEHFIISLEHVNEIVRIQEITEAPHQPEWVRGIMNLRDSVIMLVDTRKRLGLKSLIDTIRQAIAAGREAHLNWVAKLEEAVTKEYHFGLSLDPNLCAYGKWLNALLADTSTKEHVKVVLSETVEPHAEVHHLGKDALHLLEIGKKDEAIALVDQIKNVYVAKMLMLFDEIHEHFKKDLSKEIAVIVEFEGVHFAMLADEIKKMKTFSKDQRQKGSLADGPFILGIYDDDEGLYQELDLRGILKNKAGEIIDMNAEVQESA